MRKSGPISIILGALLLLAPALRAQNVGIGTTSPNAKLDVEGKARVNQLKVEGAASSDLILTSDNNSNATWSDPANLSDNDWDRSGGNLYPSTLTDNVGIGTTAPGRELEVASSSSPALLINATSGGSYQALLTVHYDYDKPVVLKGHDGNRLLTQNKGNSEVHLYTGDNRRLSVKNGLVGVDEPDPSYQLEVGGSTRINGNAYIDTDEGNNAFYATRYGADDQGLQTYATDRHLYTRYIEDDTESSPGDWHFINERDGGTSYEFMEARYNGDLALHPNNSENVGIGTDSPTRTLDIDGRVRIRGGGPSAGYVLTSNNGNGEADWTNPASLNDDDWDRDAGQNELYLAHSNDMVGIGHPNPNVKLVVRATRPRFALTSTGSSNGYRFEYHQTDEELRIQSATETGAYGGSTHMTLERNTGEIGIGLNDPGRRLEVNGNIGLNNYGDHLWLGTGDPMFIKTVNSGNNTTDLQIGRNFSYDGSDKPFMTINDDGEVGISTTSPTARLDITDGGIKLHSNNGIGFSGAGPNETDGFGENARIYYDGDFGDSFGSDDYRDFLIIEKGDGGDPDPDGGIAFLNTGNDNTEEIAMIIRGNNRVGIGTPTPSRMLEVNGRLKTNGINETSDRRLKRGIRTVDNALGTVMQLRGVQYQWDQARFPERNFAEGQQYGLIAQEVEKVLPELVHEDKQGYKSLEYTQLTGVLVEAMKDQQRTIRSLRKRLQQKTRRLDRQARRLQDQHRQLKAIRGALTDKGIEVPTQPKAQARR